MDKKFKEERQKALQDIHDAMMQKLEVLAKEGAKFQNADQMSMPEIIELQEKFRWVPATLMAAMDLKQEKPLRDVFARVSKRYQATKPRKPIQSIAADFKAAQSTDGRASAFEDMRKILKIAARDFEMTYDPLTRDQAKWWLKKHPIGDQYIRIAHKENQRHFMQQALTGLHQTLDALEKGILPPPPKPPQPGKKPRPPGA